MKLSYALLAIAAATETTVASVETTAVATVTEAATAAVTEAATTAGEAATSEYREQLAARTRKAEGKDAAWLLRHREQWSVPDRIRGARAAVAAADRGYGKCSAAQRRRVAD